MDNLTPPTPPEARPGAVSLSLRPRLEAVIGILEQLETTKPVFQWSPADAVREAIAALPPAPLAGGTEHDPSTATAEVAAGYSQEGRPVSPASIGGDVPMEPQPGFTQPPLIPSEPASGAAVSPATAWVPIVVCAAVRRKTDGLIICSARHYDPLMREIISNTGGHETWRSCDQGFIDAKGQFLTRQEAHLVAKQNNQIRHRCGGDEHELYSENLY